MTQFNSKTALIIGGTSGIGKATAYQLLNQGVTVHVVERSSQKIEDAPNLIKHQVDISNQEQVNNLISSIG